MEFPTLKKTPIFEALSKIGQDIFQPDGIFYWAGRAKKEADINGTIGTAFSMESDFIDGGRTKLVPMYLSELSDFINIEPEKLVAYAPMAGVPKMRDLWENWIVFKGIQKTGEFDTSINIEGKITKPIICSGITNSIFLASRFFLNPGEKIICPEKRWGNYDAVITRQNGIAIEIFTFFKDGRFNLKGLIGTMEDLALTQKRLVLIMNFPNNPTGYCPTHEENAQIVNGLHDFCERSGKTVVILCDDAYEGYTYGSEFVSKSLFYNLIDLHPNIIPVKMDGTSKEMLMYGARVASITLGIHSTWAVGEVDALKSEWENKLKAMVRSTLSNCNHFCQEILIQILGNGFEPLLNSRKKVLSILTDRYNECIQCFNENGTPNVTLDPSGGGFFIFLNLDGVDGNELGNLLLTKYRVGIIPIVKKNVDINGIRVAYCSIPKENIGKVFSAIDQAVRDLI